MRPRSSRGSLSGQPGAQAALRSRYDCVSPVTKSSVLYNVRTDAEWRVPSRLAQRRPGPPVRYRRGSDGGSGTTRDAPANPARPAEGAYQAGSHRCRRESHRRGARRPGQHPGDHRVSRHRLRLLLQPLRQQGRAVRDGLRRGARALGPDDRPGLRRHRRPGRGIRRLLPHLRQARLDAPRHRPLPHRRRAGRPRLAHRPGAPRPARYQGRAASRALHRPRRGRRPQRGRRRPARASCGSARTTRNG